MQTNDILSNSICYYFLEWSFAIPDLLLLHSYLLLQTYSSLAQSVERMTVNHDVAGSSPAGGAIKDLC